jgi:tRNA-Thr(GGU) m(6)t(6)A37 methyltransferase TsaA
MNPSSKLRFIGIVDNSTELSRIKIFPEYGKKLSSLKDFSHLIILYWFHLRDSEEERSTIQVIPKRHLGAPQVSVFASRSSSRPNPIGFCVVELITIEDNILTVRGLDAFEGSPIVDIKPYLPRADSVPNATTPQWFGTGPKT